MEISSFQATYFDLDLTQVVDSLTQGLRTNIPYPDTQVFAKARLTASIVDGSNIDLYDVEIGDIDTVGLIMELENGIRGVLEPNYNIDNQHGAAISAVYCI